MEILKALWSLFKRVGFAVGEFISQVVRTIFYYTVFALFALMYKMFGKSTFVLGKQTSTWVEKTKNLNSLDDLRLE